MINIIKLPPDRKRPCIEPLDASTLDTAAQAMQQAFDELLSQDPVFSEILKKINLANVKMVVFGGWARDRLLEVLESRKTSSRDIDFVVDSASPITEFFPEGALENQFGGVGIPGKVTSLEAWNLHNTFLFKQHNQHASFTALPATADYDVNALLFFPSQCHGQPSILDAGAGNALKSGCLDFMADEVAQPKIQAARAVIFATKLKLKLSEAVCDFVQDVCEDSKTAKEVQTAIDTYCPSEFRPHALQLLAKIRQGRMGGDQRPNFFSIAGVCSKAEASELRRMRVRMLQQREQA